MRRFYKTSNWLQKPSRKKDNYEKEQTLIKYVGQCWGFQFLFLTAFPSTAVRLTLLSIFYFAVRHYSVHYFAEAPLRECPIQVEPTKAEHRKQN